jgi:hypothetical protein
MPLPSLENVMASKPATESNGGKDDDRAAMGVLSYCPACKKQVTVTPLVSREALKSPVNANALIQVMHRGAESDHIWTLNARETANLRKKTAEGLVGLLTK